MLKRLRQLQNELSEWDYCLLIGMVLQDIKYHSSIGSNFTEEKLVELVDNSLMVLNRL